MIGPREECPSCHRPHPDLHLPPDNAKEKTLAMDDRDINELIDNINTAAAYVLRTDTTPGFARGYGSCTDTIVGLLRNYVAR